MKKMLRASLSTMILAYSCNSYGNINTILKNVMPTGTMTNVTNTAIVNEQEAGHVLGGSISVSSPGLSDVHLLNVEAPSCRFGGGPCDASFDLHAGGLSFIKAAALTKFVKDLGNQAGTYALLMLIKSICPHCEQGMTWLQDVAQAANGMSLEGCKAMEMIANGPLARLSAGSDATKQTAILESGDADDMSSLQQKSKEDKGDESTKDLPELKSLLGDNFNLVWKALDEKANNKDDNEFKQFLMSLSGTVIGKKEDGVSSVTHKRGLVDNKNLAKFMGVEGEGGEKIEIYQCDENKKCLDPKKIGKDVKEDTTIKAKVRKLVDSIVKKIATDGREGDLTNEEKSLVALSNTKLINKIESDFAQFGGNIGAVIIAQNDFLDVLCYDVVTQYLAKMLTEVREAVSELSYGQLGDYEAFESFERHATEVMQSLAQSKENAYNRHAAIVAYQERILQQGKYQQHIILKRIQK